MASIIPIETINEIQFAELLAIVSDKRTMATIGTGRAWSEARLREIMKYSAADNAIQPTFRPDREYYYWAIVAPTRADIIGFVGLHPLPRNVIGTKIQFPDQNGSACELRGLQIVVAVAEKARGQRYAQTAIEQVFSARDNAAIARDRPRIWIITSSNNLAGIRAFSKIRSVRMATTRLHISGKEYVVFG